MRTRGAVLVIALLAVSLLPRASAQQPGVGTPPGAVRVELATGDVLIGQLLSWDGNELVLQHPRFGKMVIPKADLVHPDQLPPPVIPEVPPAEWKGTADAGITGASGNSNNSLVIANVKMQKKEEDLVKDINFTYRRNEQENDVSEERWMAEGRLTWPEKDSPWRTFAQASLEHDQFKDYSYRAAVAGGRGYAWYDTEATFLEGRFGLGVSKEWDSPDDDLTPELVLGVDYRHNYTKTEAVTAGAELFPSLRDFPDDYRWIARAAWEQKLDEASPWVFRLGLEDKYDRTAGDAKHNDFIYFASLGYNF
jgi:hypothetical protein